MKLIWHIFKKDLRRLALPLALWAALVATKLGLAWWLLTAARGDARWVWSIPQLSIALTAIELVASYLMIGLLILEDSLVDARAPWLTRPISGARLLGAKLFGIAMMFGALPLLISLPWWLACGYGAREIAWAALETCLWTAAVAVPAMFVAVLTDGLGRFLLWTLVLVPGVVTWLAMATMKTTTLTKLPESLVATRVLLALVVVIGGAAVVVAQQFLMRRLVRSAAVAGFVAVLAMVIGVTWKWDFLLPLARRDETRSVRVDDVTLTFAGATLFPARAGEVPDQDVTLYSDLVMRGLPEDVDVGVDTAEQSWRWTDGTTVTRTDSPFGGGFSYYGATNRVLGLPATNVNVEGDRKQRSDWWEARWKRFALQGIMLPRRTVETGLFQAVVKLPHSAAARMSDDPPEYTVKARVSVFRLEVLFEVPVQAGARTVHGSAGLRIARVERRKDGVAVTVASSRAAVPLRGMSWSSIADTVNGFFMGGFIPVNRTRGEWGWCDVDRLTQRDFRIGTVMVGWHVLDLRPLPPMPIDRTGKPAPSWFDDLTLAGIAYREDGQFTRELKIGRFIADNAAAGATRAKSP